MLGNSSLGGKYAKIVGEIRAGRPANIPVPAVTIIAMNIELYFTSVEFYVSGPI